MFVSFYLPFDCLLVPEIVVELVLVAVLELVGVDSKAQLPEVHWSVERYLVVPLLLERAAVAEDGRDAGVGDGLERGADHGDNHWAGTHRGTFPPMTPDDTFDCTAEIICYYSC